MRAAPYHPPPSVQWTRPGLVEVLGATAFSAVGLALSEGDLRAPRPAGLPSVGSGWNESGGVLTGRCPEGLSSSSFHPAYLSPSPSHSTPFLPFLSFFHPCPVPAISLSPLLSLLSFSTLSFSLFLTFLSAGHPPCLFLSTVPDPCLYFPLLSFTLPPPRSSQAWLR